MIRGLAATLSLWAVGAVALRAVVVPPEQCEPVDPPTAFAAARASAAWIERTQIPDGTYLYEYDRDSDTELPGYNVVRHAGVTMSLYQLAAAGDASVLPAADRGLLWMTDRLIYHDDWAAFQGLSGSDAQLGASALMLASLEHRRRATNDAAYDVLMRQLARFLLVLQQDDGSFLNRWLVSARQSNPGERSKYATGEAFWTLTIMHRLFPGEGWDAHARRTADYLSLHRDRVERQKFPPWADQWAAYGLGEMAMWPLSDKNIAYARGLAERFGFLIRADSQRTSSQFSKLIHGRKARAAGLGTWVEGLSSLHRLSLADARMSDMSGEIEERLVCGAGLLVDRQLTAAKASGGASAAKLEGAWFTDGITRMDDQQHALSGLLYSRPALEASAR